MELIRRTVREHKRILFNGNNYSEEWRREAQRRGLLNLASTAEAIPHFLDPKNIALFARHGIFSETEMRSRCEILLENYHKTVFIEALTMLDMARHDVTPAVVEYTSRLADGILKKRAVGAHIACELEENLLERLSSLASALNTKIRALDAARGKCMATRRWRSIAASASFPPCANCAAWWTRWKSRSPRTRGRIPRTKSCSLANNRAGVAFPERRLAA